MAASKRWVANVVTELARHGKLLQAREVLKAMAKAEGASESVRVTIQRLQEAIDEEFRP